ncbi:prepilin peptidase [Amycolatopsis sp. NPDC048633]|uniref:prepilin peptidase n=1 Tax=Amycolatopsis sp. NPDC048633 TaxID=3157095 RepID=UPI0033C26683
MIRLVAGAIAAMACTPVTMALLRRAATTPLSPTVQLLCVVGTWVAGAAVGLWPQPLVPAAACLCLLAIPAAAIDVAEHRIPNQLSLPLVGAMAISLSSAALLAPNGASGVRALIGSSLWGGLLLLSFVLTGQPGPGDVKLAPSVGAILGWFGWPWLLGGLIATYLLTAVAGLVGVIAGRYLLRDGQVPMGPSMAAIALVLGTLAQV